MILNNVDDIKLGAVDVDKVYLGTTVVWERVSEIIPVYDLDIDGYTSGSNTAANLGSAGGTFGINNAKQDGIIVVYTHNNCLYVQNNACIYSNCNYNNFSVWTLKLTFKNWVRNSRWASRILNSYSNRFEMYYDGDRNVLATVLTMGVTSATAIVDNATKDGDTVRFGNITAAVLSAEGIHTIGLCCDGTNIYAFFDGTKLAYIPKELFSPSMSMGVGSFDSWYAGGTPSMDIVKFAFYDTCLY